MREQTRRRIGYAAATAAGAASLALLGGVYALPGMVESRVEAALRDAGYADAAVVLDEVGLDRAVGGVKLTGEQGIDRFTAHFSPGGLGEGRLDRLELEGARLTVAVDAGGARLVGRQSPDTAPAAGPFDLPVDRVEVKGSTVTLLTPGAEARLPLAATLQRTGPGALDIQAATAIDYAGAQGQATVTASYADASGAHGRLSITPPPDAPGGTIQGGGTLAWPGAGLPRGEMTLAVAGARLPDGSPVAGSVVWQGTESAQSARGQLEAAKAATLAFDTAWTPAAGEARAKLDLAVADLSAALALAGIESDAKGKGTLTLSGEGPAGAGLPPLAVSMKARDLALPGKLTAGSVDLAGSLVRSGGDWALTLDKEMVVTGKPAGALKAALPEAFQAGPVRASLKPVGGMPAVVGLSSTDEAQTASLRGQIGLELADMALGGQVEAAEVTLAPAGPARAKLKARGVQAAMPAYGLSTTGLSLTADYLSDAEQPLTASFRMPVLRLGQPTPWVAPLEVKGAVTGDPARALAFTLEGSGVDGRLALDVTGRQRLDKGWGSARVVLHPIRFLPNGPKPAAFFPMLAGSVEEARGVVGLRAELGWGKGAPVGNGELLLQDLSLTGASVSVQGLNGVLTAASLRPLVMPDRQLLSIGLLDVGIPLANGQVQFQVTPTQALRLEKAEFEWAGGSVRALPLESALSDPSRTLTLVAENLSLAKVLELAGVEGLSAEGRLAGNIPVKVTGRSLRFVNGRLDTVGEGTIRYDPAQPPAFLDPTKNDSTALVMQVLQNFKYKNLAVTIDGAAGREMTVAMKLEGANPDFYGGYPVALNLNLSGALYSILQSGMGAYRIPDTIKDRIQNYGKQTQ